MSPQPGTGFRIRLRRNNFASPVKMVALGAPLYPTEQNRVPGTEDYQQTSQQELDGSDHSEIYFPLSDLRALQIINDSNRTTRGDHLEIEQIEVWAGE